MCPVRGATSPDAHRWINGNGQIAMSSGGQLGQVGNGRALCAANDPEIFFPPGDSVASQARASALDAPFAAAGHRHGRRHPENGVTPEQRRVRAKIAASARWSRPMARADQADAARSAMLARLERQVDLARRLGPDERAVLVQAAGRQLSARLNAAKAHKRA